MIRKIVPAKDPKLRNVSKKVAKINKKVLSLAKDLEDTLGSQKDPEGVGLAAPQIGVFVRMFAMQYKDGIKIVINPEVISISKIKSTKEMEDVMEGCLSIPYYYGPIRRSEEISIKYEDLDGKKQKETFKGFPAQIVQHELDHLDGILFIDKLLEQKQSLYKVKGDNWEKVDLIF